MEVEVSNTTFNKMMEQTLSFLCFVVTDQYIFTTETFKKTQMLVKDLWSEQFWLFFHNFSIISNVPTILYLLQEQIFNIDQRTFEDLYIFPSSCLSLESGS